MLNIGERIKKVRKDLDLTQQEFADRLRMKRNSIAQVECGRNTSDQTIFAICREFNVNETWLRTGEGEMFDQREENIVDRLCAELHASELDAEIIRAYFRIDERIREPFMRRLLQEVGAKSAAPVVDATPATTTPTPPAGTDIPVAATAPDLAAKVAELERQNQEILRQNQEKDKQLQELTAEIKAIKEEDALYGPTGGFSASPSVSVGSIKPTEKTKV